MSIEVWISKSHYSHLNPKLLAQCSGVEANITESGIAEIDSCACAKGNSNGCKVKTGLWVILLYLPTEFSLYISH